MENFNLMLQGKAIEEMSIEELQRELTLHKWFSRSIEKHRSAIIKLFNQRKWAEAHKKAEELGKAPENLAEAYINGLITDEEYALLTGTDAEVKRFDEETADRVDYLAMIGFHEKAFCEELSERIAELKGQYKHTDRKMPKSYGYDPRKPISKKNYPRTDWGKTRENRHEHEKRKKGK